MRAATAIGILTAATLWLAGIAEPAQAQTKRIHYSAGTGFIITRDGYIITNEHVVRNCQPSTVSLSGAVNSAAEIVSINRAHDLALLQAKQSSGYVASLSSSLEQIKAGDGVMVMGYPQEAQKDGQYRVVFSKVLGVKGPMGEPHWLQFSNAAQHGNSGGPLLDESGNVIGVVTGKTELYQVNERTRQQTAVGASDVAVTLPILTSFLEQNDIRFEQEPSQTRRGESYVESRARRFIVRIQCVTHEEILR